MDELKLRSLISQKAFVRYFLVYVLWALAIMFVTGANSDLHLWVQDWMRWDAFWYEKIWNQGYKEQTALAFPPGFSLLVGLISSTFSLAFLWAAVGLNLLAHFGFSVVCTEFLARRFDINRTQLYLFILSSPVAFFAFAPYTDTLFALLLWVLLAVTLTEVRSQAWAQAKMAFEFALMLLLPWIRITGFALASWVLVLRNRFAVVGLTLSLVGWLSFNFILSQDPLHFLAMQEKFGMPHGGFFAGLNDAWKGLISPLTGDSSKINWQFWLQISLLPILYTLAFTAATIWFCVRREWQLALTVASIFAVSHNQAFWRSVIRYNWPILPLLAVPLLVMLKSNSKLKRVAIHATFALIVLIQWGLQLYFASIFHQGGWAF